MSYKHRPVCSAQLREQRAELYRSIREYFYQQNVQEINTPLLSSAANTDAYIESFRIAVPDKPRFLHTSPEYPMKRLLAQDKRDIYQICPVFRQGECGTKHNPEFTLLEWYRIGMDYHALMNEVEQILFGALALNQISLQPSEKISYHQLFENHFSIDPHLIDLSEIKAVCNSNIPALNTHTLSVQDCLDALLTHIIEPTFKYDRLTFIHDYPANQSALAKLSPRQKSNVQLAQRFEVYFGALELGNGYQEETDPARNQAILHQDNQTRLQRDMSPLPVDQHFLDALTSGLPECSGVAIGLDRVLIAMNPEINNIRDVLNFPWDNA